ncbi:MAG: NERD domain-containing protein [Thermomicrobiales bacterium]|nr:NERD domain-containing protein [Thermomicrobiales bacterium]
MRILRNSEHIKKKKKLARIAALVGFLLLASTFLLIFQPNYVLPAYAILFTGFITFNFGMQQLGKWSRSPRNDELLDHRLQSLPDARYTIVHFAQIGKRAVEHLLIGPGGLLVLIARELPGSVTVDGRRWKKKGVGLMRMFSMSGPQLGNPTADIEADVAALDAFTAELGLDVDIYGAVVFLNERVELSISNPEYPTLRAEQLASFINQIEPDPAFTPQQRDKLIAALSETAEAVVEAGKPTRRPVKVKRRAA